MNDVYNMERNQQLNTIIAALQAMARNTSPEVQQTLDEQYVDLLHHSEPAPMANNGYNTPLGGDSWFSLPFTH